MISRSLSIGYIDIAGLLSADCGQSIIIMFVLHLCAYQIHIVWWNSSKFNETRTGIRQPKEARSITINYCSGFCLRIVRLWELRHFGMLTWYSLAVCRYGVNHAHTSIIYDHLLGTSSSRLISNFIVYVGLVWLYHTPNRLTLRHVYYLITNDRVRYKPQALMTQPAFKFVFALQTSNNGMGTAHIILKRHVWKHFQRFSLALLEYRFRWSTYNSHYYLFIY